MINKRALLFIAFLLFGIVIVSLLMSLRKPQEIITDSNDLTTRTSQRSPLTPDTPRAIEYEEQLLKDKLPLETEHYLIREEEDYFQVDIYGEDREEAIDALYTNLEALGIREPEHLPLKFAGPFNYDGYEVIPQEKINEVLERYNR